MNNKHDVIVVFLIGFFTGFFIGAISMGFLMKHYGMSDEVKALKDKCELNLPRNQVCAMDYTVLEEKS